ncbi:hypothetical protein PENTCL1PPCAC_28526, partial [Pristionchus entomophagus]
LLEAICAILFLVSYFQQFLCFISCGHFFEGKKTFKREAKQQDRLFYSTATQKQILSAPGPITQKVPVSSLSSTTVMSIPSRPPREAFVDPTVHHIEPSPPYSAGSLAPDTTKLISSGRSVEPVVVFGPGASPDK